MTTRHVFSYFGPQLATLVVKVEKSLNGHQTFSINTAFMNRENVLPPGFPILWWVQSPLEFLFPMILTPPLPFPPHPLCYPCQMTVNTFVRQRSPHRTQEARGEHTCSFCDKQVS